MPEEHATPASSSTAGEGGGGGGGGGGGAGADGGGEGKRKAEGGIDAEAWLEEKRIKREERKAEKQKRALEAQKKKAARDAERAKKEREDAERAASGQVPDKKKNRGWWNRTRDSNGEIVDLEPTEEAMKPDAPHWSLMLETLKSLRQQALNTQMQGGPIPSWAFAEKGQQGAAKELAGPIVASQIKTAMIAASKKEGDEFVEQKLGFKNFSHFLQVASDQMKLVEIARDTVHKGQMWVDDVGWSDALKRAAEHQSEPEPQTVETLDSQIVLVKGQVYSKGAQYQFNWDSIERTPKLSSWDLWESMGKPRWVCAPMVEQSELPFRLLCKRYGTDLCYTPMFHARLFIEDANYRAEQFTTCKEDKPVIVQFCANDPHIFAAAAQMVAGKCDAVDLNLGCPQGIAKRGRYGSFLMDELQLVYSMVKEAHDKACVPITAKIRVFDDDAKTLQYAKCLQDAGAQLLTVHGRTRENKGRGATPADWSIIKKVKEHVSIPVISNGNVYNRHDAKRCIEETGVDAVMSAEWLRRNPALFSEGDEGSDPFRMATEYLDLCQTYPAPLGYVRAHIFKFLTDVPHGLQENPDIREQMQQAKTELQMRHLTEQLAARRGSQPTSA